jgi:hypothetical protein
MSDGAQDIKKSRSVAAGDGEQGLVSPDVVFGEEEKFMDAPFNYSEVPKVPEGIVSHFEKLREAQALAEMASGADPRILNAPKKPGARTAAGIERVDQQLTKKATVPKSKKIARVSSPDVPPPVFDTNPDLDHFSQGHDIKTCKVYGCLMCKAAKEEK